MNEMNRNEDGSPQSLNGRAVVVAMFVFGIAMTGVMWAYWELYTRPFRPLQNAIHAEFPDSSPRVIGGEHKSHKHENPRTLRIVISVDFNPTNASDEDVAPYTSRLLALADEHIDLSQYDQVEIHLVRRMPEAEAEQRSFVFPAADVVGRQHSPEAKESSAVRGRSAGHVANDPAVLRSRAVGGVQWNKRPTASAHQQMSWRWSPARLNHLRDARLVSDIDG